MLTRDRKHKEATRSRSSGTAPFEVMRGALCLVSERSPRRGGPARFRVGGCGICWSKNTRAASAHSVSSTKIRAPTSGLHQLKRGLLQFYANTDSCHVGSNRQGAMIM